MAPLTNQHPAIKYLPKLDSAAPPIITTFKIYSIRIITQLPTKDRHQIMASDHTDFTISPDSLPSHPSSCRPTATLHPSNGMSGICQPGKINPFQSDHLSMIPAQQESARHQSSPGPTRRQSESRAPNALPSLSNAADPFRSHGPVESSLDGDVNSNSNQVRHHVIKHRGMDSQINPFQSDPLSVTSVQHECIGHQSNSVPTMSSSVDSDSTALIVALMSLSNAENPYTGYGPIQLSSRCHEIKQNSRNSNDSLHVGVGGLPELKLKYNNSAILHGYPPSNGRSNQSRPVCLDDLSHGHKGGGMCAPYHQ